MNRFIIKKASVLDLIEYTAAKSKDIRLYRKNYWKIFPNKPVKIHYCRSHSIRLKIELEVRFGVDLLKASEKISNEMRTQLEKLAKISVESMELVVKGVFDEKENPESN